MDRPQANTDQRSADLKALEEALSGLVGEGPSDWRTKMASSDALRPVEPSPYTTPRPVDLKGKIGVLSDTPPPGRRFLRALTRFLVVAFIGVGCTLAWQSYGETAKQKLATFAPQLGWVLSLAGLKPSPGAELVAERPSAHAVQESELDLPQAATAAQTAPNTGAPTAPAARAPEVQQQLEAMARDLAILRQSVDQLALGQERMARDLASLQAAEKDVMARDLADLRQTVNQLMVSQEQMARDIATLQATEKDSRPKVSASKPAAAPARSPAPKPRLQATPQILAVPPPPTPSSVQSASPPPVQTGFPIQDARDDAWREWSRSRARPSETPPSDHP